MIILSCFICWFFKFSFFSSYEWSQERWKMERFSSSVFEVSVAGFAIGQKIGQLLAVFWLVAFDAWWALKIQSFQEVSIMSRTDSLNQPVKSIIVQKTNVCSDQINDHWNDWKFHLFEWLLLLWDCRIELIKTWLKVLLIKHKNSFCKRALSM